MGKRYVTDARRLDPESAKQVLEEVVKLDRRRKRAHTLAKKKAHELWSYVYDYRNFFTYREFGEVLGCTPENIFYRLQKEEKRRKQQEQESQSDTD